MACQRTLPSIRRQPFGKEVPRRRPHPERQSEGNASRSANAWTSTCEVKPRTRGSGSRSCPKPFGMEPTQSTIVEATGIRPGMGATKRTVEPWSLIKTSTLVASGAGRAKIKDLHIRGRWDAHTLWSVQHIAVGRDAKADHLHFPGRPGR